MSAPYDPSVPTSLRYALARHSERFVSRKGVRRVEIDVCADGAIQLHLQVGQAWHAEQGVCHSLFCVLPGSPLSGTTVLMREQVFMVDPQIWVRPSTAKQPVAVAAHRSEDCILGTDFSYDDVRMWTPRLVTAAMTAELAGDKVLLRSVWNYRGRVRVIASGCLDECGLLVAADLAETGATRSFRQFRAKQIRTIDGMPTPLIMQAMRPVEGFNSVMRLRAMGAHDVAPELFAPEQLADAAMVVAALAMEAPMI